MVTVCPRIGALAVLVMALSAGCSNNANDNLTDGNAAIPQVLSVQPADSATGVPQGANIRLVFNTPMDTASVDHAFHLAGGPDMLRWLDSLHSRREMNGPKMGMDSIMRGLDSLQYRGSFQWNDRADTVVFIPDTQLIANQPQLMLLYGVVKGQNGHAMVLDTLVYGGYMTQFTTGSQASP